VRFIIFTASVRNILGTPSYTEGKGGGNLTQYMPGQALRADGIEAPRIYGKSAHGLSDLNRPPLTPSLSGR
jgi:hypothetical protein